MIRDFFKDKNEKPFHSSGYAKVSQGKAIGSSSSQSFGQRTHVERNRSSVARYGSSMVGQGYIHRDVTPRVGGYDQARVTSPSASRNKGVLPRTPAAGVQTRAFREPPARHNPYS
jgi:hypothetical protein